MSDHEAPHIEVNENNNPDLLSQQSGTPNMSSTKTFTVDTNMRVNGDLSVLSNGAFAKVFAAADPGGDSDAPVSPKLLSIGGDSLWDAEIEVLNDFKITTGDDIELNAGDDVDISAEENVKITSVDYMDLISEDNIYLTAEGKIDLEADDYIELNSEVRVIGDLDATGTVTATSFIGDGSQLTGISGGGVGLDSAGVTLLVDSDYVQARQTPQDFAYSSLTGAPTALSSFTNDTNFVDSVGVISAVTSSDLDMGGNKVLFSNVYPTEADLPDATANHGMFAHVHATGAGYFAHAGSWVQLANDADIPVGGGLDSAGVTSLIDSDYVQLKGLFYTGIDKQWFGPDAGFQSTSVFSVAVGRSAGANSVNSTNSIAIGYKAGFASQGESIHIGRETGEVNPGPYLVSIGTEANQYNAGAGSVAIGYRASQNGSGAEGISIGKNTRAGGDKTIVIGAETSTTDDNAIAIGFNSESYLNGQYSVALATSAAGSLTYNTTNDWTFGAGVTMTDLVASGATVVFNNLPTVDPVNAGQLWNDAGTMKISAG